MQERTRLVALVDFARRSARLRAKAVSSMQGTLQNREKTL